MTTPDENVTDKTFVDFERYAPLDANRSDPFNTGELRLDVGWTTRTTETDTAGEPLATAFPDGEIDIQILTMLEGRDLLLSMLNGQRLTESKAAIATLPSATDTTDGEHATLNPVFQNGVDVIENSGHNLLYYALRDNTDGSASDVPPNPNNSLTTAEYDNLKSVLETVMTLLVPQRLNNALVTPTSGNQPIHPLSGLLGKDLAPLADDLIRSFEAAGLGTAGVKTLTNYADGSPSVPSWTMASDVTGATAALQRWQDNGKGPEILDELILAAQRSRVRVITEEGEVLPDPTVTFAPTTTAGFPQPRFDIPSINIQDLIRFEYVQRGHDQLFDILKGLKDKQTVEKETMDLLNGIQDVMNQKSPEAIQLNLIALYDTLATKKEGDDQIGVDVHIDMSGDDEISKDDYATRVGLWERDQFDRELQPVVNSAGIQNDITNLDTLINSAGDQNIVVIFKRQFPDYTPTTVTALGGPAQLAGSMMQHMRAKLDAQIARLNELGLGEGNLIATLRQVRADINGAVDLQDYVKDFAPRGAEENGLHQSNIGKAYIAVQGQNDASKEQLRRRMFEFEEFIKSASSVMLKITQIIEKIAQGIRGV